MSTENGITPPLNCFIFLPLVRLNATLERLSSIPTFHGGEDSIFVLLP